MKKFSQYLDQNGLTEWLDRRNTTEVPLVEVKLSRVFQYVEDDTKDFGIVSAFRGENSREDNKKLHDDLKKRVRDMGYGYIEMKGGYQEEGGVVVVGAAAEQLDVERALALLETQLVDDGRGLLHADLLALGVLC